MIASLHRCALIAAVGILPAMRAADLPTLSDSPGPFSFAVLGDMHYSRPDFGARTTASEIAATIKDFQPAVAFVCQTGDLVHGERPEGGKQLGKDEMREELAFAVNDLAEQFRLPLFIAVGNHDKNAGGTPYPEVVLPVLSRELGAPISRLYYAFRHGNSCFIFLDYGDYSETGTTMDYAAQRKFLEETLTRAQAIPGIRHVFTFGHFPLWPVMRPGFRSHRFTDSVVPVLKQYPVDAYFCGHTHNTGAWVRRVDGVPITQIKGVAMGKSTRLQPMEESRTPLIPRDELVYGWGCLSGPPNGFFLVSVDGARVRVQFRSGGEVLREFGWQQPGQITDTVRPASRNPVLVTGDDLQRATAATLIFTPWAEERSDVSVVLNGEKITQAKIDPMPRYAAFANETRIALPAENLKGLRLENEISIENPGRSIFGIGNVRLDVTLAGGATASTHVSERYVFSASKAEAEAARKATYGWEIVPAEVIAAVNLGQPLGPTRLSFPAKTR